MNSSARWNRLSYFALAALTAGALAFGCTVTTGEIDDPNGGKGSKVDKDSGTPDDDSGTTTDPDATTPDPANECPDSKQPDDFFIGSAACQACAEQNCCNQLTGCFSLDPGVDGEGNPNPTCRDYADWYEDCAATCYETPDAGDDDIDACVDECRIGNPAIADAWEAVRNCAIDKCAATCAGQ